jgi:hypothetical protein
MAPAQCTRGGGAMVWGLWARGGGDPPPGVLPSTVAAPTVCAVGAVPQDAASLDMRAPPACRTSSCVAQARPCWPAGCGCPSPCTPGSLCRVSCRSPWGHSRSSTASFSRCPACRCRCQRGAPTCRLANQGPWPPGTTTPHALQQSPAGQRLGARHVGCARAPRAKNSCVPRPRQLAAGGAASGTPRSLTASPRPRQGHPPCARKWDEGSCQYSLMSAGGAWSRV